MGSWNWVLTRTAPPPFLFLWGFYFPLSFCFSPFFSYAWGPLGREEGEEGSSIFCPFGTVTSLVLQVHCPLPVSLLPPPPFPRLSSFPLPADMADLLSHAPCRQLARWAGASGAVNRAALSCRFVRVPYFCVLIEVTHKKEKIKKKNPQKKNKTFPLLQMISPTIRLDPETSSPLHPPCAPPIN